MSDLLKKKKMLFGQIQRSEGTKGVIACQVPVETGFGVLNRERLEARELGFLDPALHKLFS